MFADGLEILGYLKSVGCGLRDIYISVISWIFKEKNLFEHFANSEVK